MSKSLTLPITPRITRVTLDSYLQAAHSLSALEHTRPLLIICDNALIAHRFYDEVRYFMPSLKAHLFSDWETLPYDHFSPHPDLVSTRLATLYALTQNEAQLIVTTLATALMPLPPRQYLLAHSFSLKKRQKLNLDSLRKQCAEAGYMHVNQVLSHGEISVRGGLIDLFPMGTALPLRIDLFDDEIESIHTFDVDTQRRLYPVPSVQLLPAREYPLDKAGIEFFRGRFRETFEGDPQRARIYKDLSQGTPSGGVEWYLPLFFEHTARLLDYLPEQTVVCLHGDLDASAQSVWQDTELRYRSLRGNPECPILPPETILLKADVFFASTRRFARIQLNINENLLADLSIERHDAKPLQKLHDFLNTFKGRVLIAAESLGRREVMSAFFNEHGLQHQLCDDWHGFINSDVRIMLGVCPATGGAILNQDNIAVITEFELYAHSVRQTRRREKARQREGIFKNLAELHLGDPVVHEQHGVGRYQGLVSLEGHVGEFLMLAYLGDDKLYVPVSQLFLISRYSGGPTENAPLHRLGSGQWEKAKNRALRQARDTAAELLNLYALRATRQGHSFSLNTQDYERFCADFPFEETPDQQDAITNVIKDMQAGRPMDRLVCGDVGFGKTEVALRAAFVAVMGGRQVAMMVPTTLLAEQHYRHFCERFAKWPVKIAEVSRFRSASEQQEAIRALAVGQVDIIIGTHRLIQSDVRFRDLGLLILDEEHRFGVRQKEKLKALRAEVDVLTLTATPIPRTLSMAMEGLREFSIISTPPQKRLSIKTFHTAYATDIIIEAASREFQRGGQVYFLHNEVATIHAMREKLEAMLPSARIAVAHGQMPERELEQVMRDFYHQRYQLLLCTTIIETGIDIPNANTIIIHDADRFGLSQLHQLRGRVGRSHHQAYAYLLTDAHRKITPQAAKRLEAIQLMEDLGAGFYLAMHDLEIRGAGELLGESQSGEIQEVGFQLYSDMLNRAVKQLQSGQVIDLNMPLQITSEVNLHLPAFLPSDYCGDVHERLVLYKRLASVRNQDELDFLSEELVDRFGVLPPPTEALIACHRLRLLTQPVDVIKVDATDSHIQFQFKPRANIDPVKLVGLLQRDQRCRMNGADKLRISTPSSTLQQRLGLIEQMVQALQ